MTSAAISADRAVTLTREGEVFRLSFRFDPDLVRRAKTLPFASFDGDTRTWTALVCAQSVQALRRMFYDGLVDVPVDSLLADGESPEPCLAAELRPGTARRPYYVHLAMHGDNTFEKVRAIPGAVWEKRAQALSFPPRAAVALAEFVDRGVIADPGKLLSPAETVIAFDTRTGQFAVRGPDPRAAAAFAKNFPASDIVSAWQERGLDVAFADRFTVEMYRGELARRGPGFQPDGLQMPLFDFQAQHVAVALERSGYGVFDAPGLGKTGVGIGIGVELLKRGDVTRVIAVVPAAVRSQWAGEIARFTGATADDIAVVKGGPDKRAAAYSKAQTAPWLVIHYDVLARDKKQLKALFAGALVIADEAHRLKNYQAQRTVATLELARGAARRVALTGTPSERDPSEFYQVLSGFACPDVLGSPQDFNGRYRYKSRFGGYEGARNLRELRERAKCYFGRNTKEQVATHLPPLRVQQIVLDPEPAYAAALKRAHREAADEIKEAAKDRLARGHAGQFLLDQAEADEVETGAEMTAVSMLRLMCSSPKLVAESDAAAAQAMRDAGLVPDEDGPKLDELRVMLAELKAAQELRKQQMADDGVTEATPAMVHGERMVVFTFSKRMANLISARLDEDEIKHVLFTGDTSNDDRDAAVAEFTDPNSDVIAFIATDAAAEGLNLGRCCSTLVNLDLPWTPSRLIQRSNRIHRLDGTAPAYLVINFVIANTMELGVSRLIGQRADISDALFGENGGRYAATGKRGGRSVFEEAMAEYTPGSSSGSSKPARRAKASKQAGADEAVPLPPEPADDEFAPPEPDADPAPRRPTPPDRPDHRPRPAASAAVGGSEPDSPTQLALL